MAGFSKVNEKKINKQRATAKSLPGVVVGDALIALGKAVRKLGFDGVEEVERIAQTMMGPESIPFIHYTTTEGVDIPYGAYRVPGLGLLTPSFGGEDGQNPIPEVSISIVFETGANETAFAELFNLIDQELKNYPSLFRGRAIRVMSPTDMMIPHLIDLSTPPNIFLNPEVEREVETNLFTPIRRASELRAWGIKAQRGVLLHGKYGTGKSLVAYQAAQESVAVGRTFVLCTANMLRVAVSISRFLQPSTLFVEDMDALTGSYTAMSQLRNMLSGVESKKGYDTITVLTTNFLDAIIRTDRSLLRPERIDAVIEMHTPNARVVEKLVQHAGNAGNGYLAPGPWHDLYDDMAEAETTPAIIIEIMNRAKIEALSLGEDLITPDMVRHHYDAMLQQIALSTPIPPPTSVAQQLMNGIYQAAQYGSKNGGEA